MIPKLKENKQKSLGNIKLSDGIKSVNTGDRNLTDGLNVWYKNGCLCTRPAFSLGDSMTLQNIDADTLKLHKECRKIIGSNAYSLLIFVERNGDGSAIIKSAFVNEADSNDRIALKDLNIWATFDDQVKVLPVSQAGNLYYFVTLVNTVDHYTIPEGIYKVSENEAIQISDEEIYAPTVAVGCLPSSAVERNVDVFGKSFEDYNLIGGYYKMQFSTVDRYAESNKMIYPLLHSIWNDEGGSGLFESYVTAEIKTHFGTYTHKVFVPMGSYGGVREETIGADGLYLNVDADSIYFTNENGEVATVTPFEFIENNMTVTAPCHISFEDKRKVYSMSLVANFKGKEDKGERVFLAGNSEDKYGGLILWSDSEKPLYFPKNCQTQVGKSDEKITALGKTAYMLTVFKQSEIYGAFSKDLSINKGDFPGSYAEFPFNCISTKIGCDCPDTVALCNTRLVWAVSDGKIYALVSNTQGSNTTVYEVSMPLENKLSSLSKESFKKGFAIDVFNKYFLNVGGDFFLMDYLSYGFNRLGSFSEKVTAREQIPWWHWQTDWDNTAFLLAGQNKVTLSRKVGQNLEFVQSNDGMRDYNGKPIETHFTTKFFDFGEIAKPKVITEVTLFFGNKFGNEVSVEYLSDSGTDNGRVSVQTRESSENSPTYFGIKHLRPMLPPCHRFGLKIYSKTPLSVESLDIKYR